MSNPRRYRVDQKPQYDKQFALRRSASGILNESLGKVNLNDKNSLLIEKIQLAGSETKPDYFALGDSKWKLARIPALEQNLKLNEKAKNDEVQAAELAGQMTDKIIAKFEAKKLEIEARLDIAKEELVHINRRISKIEEAEQKTKKSKVLARGTIGAAKLKNGIVHEIDGMRVELREGVPTIVEPNVKYEGMKVVDYRQQVVMQAHKK